MLADEERIPIGWIRVIRGQNIFAFFRVFRGQIFSALS